MAGSPPPRPPRVSVAVASYNHGRFLRENLDSLLGQTFRDFEIVVVDDGSNDGSLDILTEYQSRHPHSIRRPDPRGPAQPGHVRHAQPRRPGGDGRLRRHPGLGRRLASRKSWSGRCRFSKPTRASGLSIRRLTSSTRAGAPSSRAGVRSSFGNGSDDLLRGLLAHNFVPAMTLVYRRSILRAAPPFREDLLFADWDLNIRLAMRTRLVYVPSPLAKYRRHPAAATSAQPLIRHGMTQRLALTRVVLGYAEVKERPDYREIRQAVNRAAAEHALYLSGLATESGDHGIRSSEPRVGSSVATARRAGAAARGLFHSPEMATVMRATEQRS